MPVNKIKLPLLHADETSSFIMYQVVLALVPGIAVLVWAFGFSVLTQIGIALITTILAEALVFLLRGKPIISNVFDGSGIVTAILLAIALPPTLPWWIVVIGSLFAIILAKHLYGGTGFNIFNPAMMGYVALIIAFPKEMTSWANIGAMQELSIGQQLALAFNSDGIDAYTGATPLTGIKDSLAQGLTIDQHFAGQELGIFGMKNWEYINFAFLLGGLYLLWRRIISWHIPVVLLLSFSAFALVFNLVDPQIYSPASFQMFAGGTMLGAFFIATDPVTGPASVRGKMIFAFMVGSLEYIIRTFGGYPDGVAFAVVISNMFVPLIDYYTGPVRQS